MWYFKWHNYTQLDNPHQNRQKVETAAVCDVGKMAETLINSSDYQYYDLDPNYNASAFVSHYPPSSPYSSSSVSTDVPVQQLLETVSTITSALLSSTMQSSLMEEGEANDTYPGPCDPGSPIFNCSVEMFLERVRGPQTLPMAQAITVSFVNEGMQRRSLKPN